MSLKAGNGLWFLAGRPSLTFFSWQQPCLDFLGFKIDVQQIQFGIGIWKYTRPLLLNFSRLFTKQTFFSRFVVPEMIYKFPSGKVPIFLRIKGPNFSPSSLTVGSFFMWKCWLVVYVQCVQYMASSLHHSLWLIAINMGGWSIATFFAISHTHIHYTGCCCKEAVAVLVLPNGKTNFCLQVW